MRRFEDWPRRLSNYISSHKNTPLKWGEHDCMQFASRWVELATGVNFHSEYGEYDSEEGAKELIEKHGGLIQMVDKALGAGHKGYMRAKRGDVVMIKTPLPTLGIVSDDGTRIALVSELGVIKYPLTMAVRVWEV